MNKDLFAVLYLSIYFFLLITGGGVFSEWLFNKDFVFDTSRIALYAKIGLVGIPIGIAIWLFEYRGKHK